MNSVTQAMRARDILRANKIISRVKRMPSRKGRGPCSYGLVIENDFDKAIEILREKGISFSGRAYGGEL